MSSLNIFVLVLVVYGVYIGLVMCLIFVIYGDEFNGIEIVCRVLYKIELENLNGIVIGMLIVNLDGFCRVFWYMSDCRDFNCYFFGNFNGSYVFCVV